MANPYSLRNGKNKILRKFLKHRIAPIWWDLDEHLSILITEQDVDQLRDCQVMGEDCDASLNTAKSSDWEEVLMMYDPRE